MKKRIILATGLTALLTLSACATDADGGLPDDLVGTAVQGAESITDTTLSADGAESVAKLQTSLDVLRSQLDSSVVGPELEVAWAELRARVTDTAAAAQLDAEVDSTDLESAIDSFESQLEGLDAEPALLDAWAEFRSSVTEFLSRVAA